MVKDDQSKVVSVSYATRDGQNRWKKVERNWTPNTHEFSRTISWNRVFADGITAPIGSYPVRVYAEDAAGNVSWKDAEIVIPGVDDPPLPTFTPTPTVEPTEEVVAPPADATATPTPIPPVSEEDDEDEETAPFVFGGNTPDDSPDAEPVAPAPSSSVLWGAAAAAAIGTYQATMTEKKRREEEAARAKRNSESAQRRLAEKEGRLASFLRDRRKSRDATKQAKEARILQKDADRRAAKNREESGLTGKELREKEAQQAIWDANGAAIWAANQKFKEEHGKEMDAATREQALKDATVNGVFDAAAYATKLNTAHQVAEYRERQERARKVNPSPASQDSQPPYPYTPGNRDPWKDIDHENMSKQAGSFEELKSTGMLTSWEAQYGYPMVKWARDEFLSGKYVKWEHNYYPNIGHETDLLGEWVLEQDYDGQRVGDLTNGLIPVGCADLVDLAHFHVGIDLQTLPTDGIYENRVPRDTSGLKDILTYPSSDNLHTWGDGTSPELGDTFLLKNEKEFYYHAGIITQVHGTTADKIWVLETTGQSTVPVEITVEELFNRANETDTLFFGHPDVP